MFVRFSKGDFCETRRKTYLKAVLIGNTLVMECGDAIVGIARLYQETEKYFDYDVVVAGKHSIGAEAIARKIKDMIGKANKFSNKPSQRRRKYQVDVRPCEVLPVTASIILQKV